MVLYCKNKKYKISVNYNIKDYVPLLLILFISFIFSYQQFELHGMGQDEGVYQIKAIALMEGYTDNQLDFEEYGMLKTEYGKEVYRDLFKYQEGFDNYTPDKPTLSEEKELSDVSGNFHGIPTYSALLALWGSMFGISNMFGFQILVFLCAICLLWFVLELINCKITYKILFTLLFGVSPQVLWMAKSTLTEMLLAVIILMFFYIILSDDEKLCYVSPLCILVFSFYHVSLFTVMPYFFITYILLYLYSNKKKYLISGIIALVCFEIGFIMMTFVSAAYTFNNVTWSLNRFLPFIKDAHIIPLSIICVMTGILINLFIYRFIDSAKIKISKWINLIIYLIITGTFLIIFYNLYNLYIETESIINAINQLSFSGYLYSVGIFVGLSVTVLFVLKVKELVISKNSAIIAFSFYYFILFISAFLRKDIPHYYYYGRYLVPYICIFFILGALLWTNWDQKYRVILAVLNITLSIVIGLPYSIVMIYQKDDTRMNWNILNDIVNIVDDDSVIIFNQTAPVDKDLILSTLLLPLKYMTDAYVYPIIPSESELYFSEGKSTYLITAERINSQELVYTNLVFYSDDNHSSITDETLIPYAKSFENFKYPIFVYKITDSYGYLYNDYIIGFSGKESDFIWTNAHISKMKLYAASDNNNLLKIYIGSAPKVNINVSMQLNDNYLGSFTVEADKTDQIFEFQVDEDSIDIGENVITFESNLWSPSDYGSEDDRELGFSIKKVTVE